MYFLFAFYPSLFVVALMPRMRPTKEQLNRLSSRYTYVYQSRPPARLRAHLSLLHTEEEKEAHRRRLGVLVDICSTA